VFSVVTFGLLGYVADATSIGFFF